MLARLGVGIRLVIKTPRWQGSCSQGKRDHGIPLAPITCGTGPFDSRCQSALSERAEAVPMHNEFTAVFERDGDWYVAYSPEIPGANGQGRTKEEARDSLAEAIALILADRREDGLRGVPPDAERETVIVR